MPQSHPQDSTAIHPILMTNRIVPLNSHAIQLDNVDHEWTLEEDPLCLRHLQNRPPQADSTAVIRNFFPSSHSNSDSMVMQVHNDNVFVLERSTPSPASKFYENPIFYGGLFVPLFVMVVCVIGSKAKNYFSSAAQQATGSNQETDPVLPLYPLLSGPVAGYFLINLVGLIWAFNQIFSSYKNHKELMKASDYDEKMSKFYDLYDLKGPGQNHSTFDINNEVKFRDLAFLIFF